MKMPQGWEQEDAGALLPDFNFSSLQQPDREVMSAAAAGGVCEDGSPVDTLACKADGLTEQQLLDFFQVLPGFVKLRYCVKNCFVKFSTPDLASEAVIQAQAHGFT